MRGGYPPGTPLSEARLARELRTSRTPVREGLSRLLEEGYVERMPGRGFFVARITVPMIQNVFEVRRLLEGAAAARAAEQSTPQVVARARALADAQRVADTPSASRRAFEANSQFHAATPCSSTWCATASTRSRASWR